jgi:hypothetical protein
MIDFFSRLPPILYDLFLFVLTVYQCIRTAPRNWRRTPLIWVLIRDGSWAFGVVFGLYPPSCPFIASNRLSIGVFCLDGLFFYAFRGPIASTAWAYVLLSFFDFLLAHLRPSGGSSPSLHLLHVALYYICIAKPGDHLPHTSAPLAQAVACTLMTVHALYRTVSHSRRSCLE